MLDGVPVEAAAAGAAPNVNAGLDGAVVAVVAPKGDAVDGVPVEAAAAGAAPNVNGLKMGAVLDGVVLEAAGAVVSAVSNGVPVDVIALLSVGL